MLAFLRVLQDIYIFLYIIIIMMHPKSSLSNIVMMVFIYICLSLIVFKFRIVSNLILGKDLRNMRRIVFHCFIFVQFGFILCSEVLVSSARKMEATSDTKTPNQEQENLFSVSVSISTTKADITTPLPIVPTVLNPSTTSPTINPTVLNPDTTAAPITTTAPPSPVSSGASWCVASQAASRIALQNALDYACGHSADCSPVQLGGSCYSPATLRDHASYAFNSYYQKNPIPLSCNFGGTGVITSTDPSYGTCQYPSTSTSSSVLNTANVGSTIFGAGIPTNPTSSAAVAVLSPHLFFQICFLVVLAKNRVY